MCDVFKMFTRLQIEKRGVDCDDLYYTLVDNLDISITKDEVFIVFYKLDKDGDGIISYGEMCDCFMPRENEYANMLNTRGGFHGGETDVNKFFEEQTRKLLKKFIRNFIECEV